MNTPLPAESRTQLHGLRDALVAEPAVATVLSRHESAHAGARVTLIYDALVANFAECYGPYRAQEALCAHADTHEGALPEELQDKIDDEINPSLVRRSSLVRSHYQLLEQDIGKQDAERLMGRVIRAAINDYESVTGLRLTVPSYSLGEARGPRS